MLKPFGKGADMRILKSIIAMGLCAAITVGTMPIAISGTDMQSAGIQSAGIQSTDTQSTDTQYTGGGVTYYAMKESAGPLIMPVDNMETVNEETDKKAQETAGTVYSDALYSEQWALHNDGSFAMTSGKNDHDVYDDPFDSPFGPGQWWEPIFDVGKGFWFGFGLKDDSLSQTTALAGIDINIEEARTKYEAKGSKKEVVVALIDTGVDYSHEDLGKAIWINEDEIPDNGIDDDGNGYIDDFYGWNFYDNSAKVFTGRSDDHGTHGAGTIAASIGNGIGVSSVTGGDNVRVMVLKALGGSGGTGETLSVVQAIKYAEENGASIVNLSLGSTYPDELLYSVMAESPMLFVVAAGNGSTYSGRGYNTDTTPCYPASYDLDNIISVANIASNGRLHSSSNYGEKSVDIAAPGTYILSTTPDNGYGYMTGTSMSAPFVSAAAAMIYSYYDGITLKDVKTILLESAKKLETLNGAVACGGMLDVGAALSYDTEKLSHEEFKKKTASGAAPEISYKAYLQNEKLYIVVTVTDPDNDIYALAHGDGELTAGDFAYGSNGTSFKLERNSTATFVASDYGVYTFYALDSAGHETVLTVDLSKAEIEKRENTGRDNSNDYGSGYGNGGSYRYDDPWYSDPYDDSWIDDFFNNDDWFNDPWFSNPWYSSPRNSNPKNGSEDRPDSGEEDNTNGRRREITITIPDFFRWFF